MRLKLLRRRMTISAPRVAIRSAMPWPVRWAVVAIVLGFCAAIALWAFEFGRNIAGLDGRSSQEVAALRSDLERLRDERDKAQSIANTAGSLLTAERATQERLQAQLRQLEQDNQALRDDLGFFEKLIPASGAESIAVRGLQAEVIDGRQLRWQVLVIQPVKNAPEFKGQVELTLSGQLAGKPWEMPLPGGARELQLRQYRRLEGLVDLPPQAQVRQVTVRVLEGGVQRSLQTLKLG
ncbi:MAG: hypothetical protein JOY84_09495 [Curvibacter sp.]|nr:hypothetical protein [Curvibacter sp.]